MKYEDFVTYEQTKALKELGFDWECNHLYSIENPNNIIRTSDYHSKAVISDTILAPTLSQAQKWLREVKETEIIIIRLDDNVYSYTIYGEIVNVTTKRTFDTYEQALSAGIDKILELLKEENNGK